jgi:hypothetical protein
MIITLFHCLRLNSNVFYWLPLLFLEMHGLHISGWLKHSYVPASVAQYKYLYLTPSVMKHRYGGKNEK